jgi:hypothetical protein
MMRWLLCLFCLAAHYATQSGAQIRAVKAMLARLSAS